MKQILIFAAAALAACANPGPPASGPAPTALATALAAASATPPLVGTALIFGRIVLGYGDHSPVADLPLWLGPQSSGPPAARTNANGEFALDHVPSDQVAQVTDDHLAFRVDVSCACPVDVGTLEYPLVHPPAGSGNATPLAPGTPQPALNGWTPAYTATLAFASLRSNATPDQILKGLMWQWLAHFKSPDADLLNRLDDFTVLSARLPQNLYAAQADHSYFSGYVTYSVRPAASMFSRWVAGNGELSGAWVRQKAACVDVIETPAAYRLRLLGTEC